MLSRLRPTSYDAKRSFFAVVITFFTATWTKIQRGWTTLLEGKLLGFMVAVGDKEKAKVKKTIAEERALPKWEKAEIVEDAPIGKLLNTVKKSRPLGERPTKKKGETMATCASCASCASCPSCPSS